MAALPLLPLLPLLALLTFLTGSARQIEGLVEQLLLALDHLLQLAHHLLALLHLAVARDLEVLEQLLQLGEHLLGRLARAGLDHLLHHVEHLLQILALDLHRVGVERLHLLLIELLSLLGERVEILVQGPLQLRHEPLQLLVAGAFGQSVPQGVLQLAQLALGERQAAVLEMQRGVPEQRHDLVQGGLVLGAQQPPDRRSQRHEDRGVVLKERRRPAEVVERRHDLLALLRLGRETAPLLDDRARHRMLEGPCRQDHLLGLALATLIDAVDRLEPDHHRQAGPGMRGQVEIGRIVDLGRATDRPHQLDPLDLVVMTETVHQQARCW